MRSLGTHRVAVKTNSSFDFCDSPSSSGDCKDDKLFDGDTIPVDEMKDDLFDTQVVDYDDVDNDNTQRVDSNEETQLTDLAGETQIMDEYDDYAGDTQLVLSDSETECESDEEGAGRTQVLDDTVHLNDIQIPDTSDKRPNGEAMPESLPSVDVTRRSDSIRRGFASVRTASLRASGIAARKMASKNAGNEFCSATFSSGSSKCHSVNNDGICTGEKVDSENDMAKHDENGLAQGLKSDVSRFLARKLFTEEDVPEGGEDFDLEMAKFSQPLDCDNDLAGLSYLDSQEPGELSQANALEFVDRFLKVNLLEPDEDLTRKNAVCDTPAGLLKKGANSVAQYSNSRSRAASASVFEWDDKVEDEGGGEFFIKKRELLFGNRRMARNSCSKTSTSAPLKTKVSQLPGGISNEHQQNVQATIKGFVRPDSKFVKGRKAGKLDIQIEKNNENCMDQQSCLDVSDRLTSDAPCNPELAELADVGIDTQMAAEAMEALSTVIPHLQNESTMMNEGLNNSVDRDKRGETKNVSKKRSTAQKRTYASSSGVVTRSLLKSIVESKHSIASRPRSQHVTIEHKVDSVKPRVKRSGSNVNRTSNDHKKQPLDRELLNVDGIVAENHLKGKVHVHASVAPKRNSANDKLDDSREGRQSIDGVRMKKRKTRSDTASLYPNTGMEAVNLSVTGDRCMRYGPKGGERDLQQNCDQDTGSGKDGLKLTAYGPCEVAFSSITRQTRSKCLTHFAQRCKDENGLYSGVIPSTENAPSLEKEATCTPPAKEKLADTVGGSCRKIKKSSSPADITPNNLKTPSNAVSPICVGDDYHTPSCKKSLFLKKECYNLIDSEDRYSSPFRVLRQRRDMNNVRVLFSQHLDEDIVKQQKKILSRLGFYEASSILEATHFVADVFTRTRNMLEAIANAKLIVTHLWLESCGQANCFIDEKNYILRDSKKEKELGFSMPMSLARASRHPILEGRRVLLTPNIKPSKDVISSLIKAVHGQAIGRLCRSTSNNIKLLDDLLILSCEEDLEVCSPLLEKGIAVYSSELLLNGIITQRLEYERHRLFVSHVKKTRSTLWLKKEGDKLFRVPKMKKSAFS
ncbi:hypothetical protein vseg_007873 [Gypsophila vaccaria]